MTPVERAAIEFSLKYGNNPHTKLDAYKADALNKSVQNRVPMQDLSKTPTNYVKPIYNQPNPIRTQQIENFTNRLSNTQLQQQISKGGAYGEAAKKALDSRGLNAPKGIPVNPQPYSPPPPPNAPPVAPPPIGLAPAIAPILTGAAAFLTAFLWSPQPAGDKDELKIFRDNQAKARDSDRARSTNRPPVESYTPPFNGGQSEGVLYRINFDVKKNGLQWESGSVVIAGKILGYTLDYSENPFNTRYNSIEFKILSSTIGLYGVFRNEGLKTDSIAVTRFDVSRADGYADIGGGLPNPNAPPVNTTPPPVYPPDNFPYGTINVNNGKPDPEPQRLPTPKPTLKPFAEPPPPIPPSLRTANSGNPSLSGIGGGLSSGTGTSGNTGTGTGNSNGNSNGTGTGTSGNTGTGTGNSNGNSNGTGTGTRDSFPVVTPPLVTVTKIPRGEIQPFVSKAFEVPSFTARPYVSGISDPSEYGNPVDDKTGLTRSAFEKMVETRSSENAVRSANFDAKQNQEIWNNLSNVPRANQNGKSDQQLARENYLNQFGSDPIKVQAYKDAQALTTFPVVTPTSTPTKDNRLLNSTPQNTTGTNADLTTPLLAIPAIGIAIGTVLTGIDYLKNLNNQINNQTKPTAQQTNAKQGVCDAMQPTQCGYEGVKQATIDATNPIKAIANSNAGILAGLNTALSAFIAFAQGAFAKILSFLDNSIIDRAIGAANFAMNVHNALMLSNALGRTLAGIVDTGVNLAGFQFTDTEGRRKTATQAFSTNVSSVIVNLIGQELYTELTDDWKVANRIYQSSTNLLNKTERLLSGQSKVAQKSGIDVANIGNALRANGIVNPNSYPPMAATKQANTPTELLADVNSPLSSFSAGVKNLNAISKNINGTLKQVSGIQKEFGKLTDLANKESKVRKSLRSQSASRAKFLAKFTKLQVQKIKSSGKK